MVAKDDVLHASGKSKSKGFQCRFFAGPGDEKRGMTLGQWQRAEKAEFAGGEDLLSHQVQFAQRVTTFKINADRALFSHGNERMGIAVTQIKCA